MITQKYLNDLSYKIIGCAIEVHKELGAGLLESIYEEAMYFELQSRGFTVVKQLEVPVIYKGLELPKKYKIDLLVNNEMVLELKSCDGIHPIHQAQLLTYLKILEKHKGIIINFNCLNIVGDGSQQMISKSFNDLPLG